MTGLILGLKVDFFRTACGARGSPVNRVILNIPLTCRCRRNGRTYIIIFKGVTKKNDDVMFWPLMLLFR